MQTFQLTTSMAYMLATFDHDDALVSLKFSDSSQESSQSSTKSDMAIRLETQLNEYLQNKRAHFDVLVRPNGTDWQIRVWQAVVNVPYGTTMSYSQLAALCEKPKAYRSVAHALALNPILIIIPCHRVLGAKGALCGYSGGLERKADLLSLEMMGILREPDPH